ncbi:recombinase family protein [Actinoplanes sp. N902-109]|uniref:recombinase family protein n=1 Tax=Actinoplanes sp. (strain N902-109) TaxID=649831 RepID=UPI0003296001|nr:recombinase family protein [Actinoplanes sp. N902-109]AGL19535.1 cassette chromosome recombinase B [Actinoplanes sp. N902-109]
MSRRGHLAAIPDRPGRAVLYVRVSSLMGRGGDDFHSPDIQLSAMRRAIAGMQEVAVIDDDIDVSGRSFKRTGIDRIRELAENGQIDTLAVYNISRFGRNTLESLQFLAWLTERGVTILSATEHIDTSTSTGRWMLTNMLAVAEMYSDNIGKDWSDTIRARAESGKWHGNIPLGYVKGKNGKLEPHPVHGPAITQAFTDYADGARPADVLRRLQAATGRNSAYNILKHMLGNVAYIGIVTVRGNSRYPTIVTPNAHPALVDQKTWQRVQERRAASKGRPPRVIAAKYPLTGLGKCGRCAGSVAYGRDHQPNGTVIARLQCTRSLHTANRICPGCGAPQAQAVEDAVLEKVRSHIALLRSDGNAQTAHAAKKRRAGMDAGALNKQLETVRQGKVRLASSWALGEIADATYRAGLVQLDDKENELTASLTALKAESQVLEPNEAVMMAERLVRLWGEMDGAQKNRALRDVLTSYSLAPASYRGQPVIERIEVQWR